MRYLTFIVACALIIAFHQRATSEISVVGVQSATKVVEYKFGAPKTAPFTFLAKGNTLVLTPGFSVLGKIVPDSPDFLVSDIRIQVTEDADGVRTLSLGIRCNPDPNNLAKGKTGKHGNLAFMLEFAKANQSVLDKHEIIIQCMLPPAVVHNSYQKLIGNPTKYAKSIKMTIEGTKP